MCIFWSKPLVLAFKLSQSWPHPSCAAVRQDFSWATTRLCHCAIPEPYIV